MCTLNNATLVTPVVRCSAVKGHASPQCPEGPIIRNQPRNSLFSIGFFFPKHLCPPDFSSLPCPFPFPFPFFYISFFLFPISFFRFRFRFITISVHCIRSINRYDQSEYIDEATISIYLDSMHDFYVFFLHLPPLTPTKPPPQRVYPSNRAIKCLRTRHGIACCLHRDRHHINRVLSKDNNDFVLVSLLSLAESILAPVAGSTELIATYCRPY